ncbi:hypothetical protein [Synechococcus sp. PCC 7336]|uniref:hypothetical protein n=1 Tax=Synechococcus sp. PCC 7336 TaxID=195250 RepID=UPI00036603DA|nr:hypothetical protein [Synechococcus sp. PCC 7336]
MKLVIEGFSYTTRELNRLLDDIDTKDVETSARARQLAQDLLSNLSISIDIREKVADILHDKNLSLALAVTDMEASY